MSSEEIHIRHLTIEISKKTSAEHGRLLDIICLAHQKKFYAASLLEQTLLPRGEESTTFDFPWSAEYYAAWIHTRDNQLFTQVGRVSLKLDCLSTLSTQGNTQCAWPWHYQGEYLAMSTWQRVLNLPHVCTVIYVLDLLITLTLTGYSQYNFLFLLLEGVLCEGVLCVEKASTWLLCNCKFVLVCNKNYTKYYTRILQE